MRTHESNSTGSCGMPLAAYCDAHPGDCPPSSPVPFSAMNPGFCRWLASRGQNFFGGPASCSGFGHGFGGDGFEVDWPDAASETYFFDDAGSLRAVFEQGTSSFECVAGPANQSTAGCINWVVGFGCLLDAGAAGDADVLGD